MKTNDGGIQINFKKMNDVVLLELDREFDLTGYKSLEISGTMPGQISIELYDSRLDMTDTKMNGDEYDWWETKSGGTYPFFEGSNMYRFEDGSINKAKTIAMGHVDAAGNLLATQETMTFSMSRQMVSSKDSGDYSRIKYIVLKSNSSPMNPWCLLHR